MLNHVTLGSGLRLAFRELGEGPPVLLLHGWPTSSFLWRGVMPAIARTHRVLAPDLPGFGASDKPTDVRYDFTFFDAVLNAFLAAIGVDGKVGLAGHDLGGPIAVHWSLARRRTSRLALLNTLLYPEFSAPVLDLVTKLRTPTERDKATGSEGLARVMRLGVEDEAAITDEVLAGVWEPFDSPDSRLALAKAGSELEPSGFSEIAAALPSLASPVRVIYGEQDRLLTDVADTFSRLKRDLPSANVTSVPGAGHFLLEEQPDRVGQLLATFFADRPRKHRPYRVGAW